MAELKDTYRLDSKANTTGIDQGTAAIKRQGKALDDAAKKGSTASGVFSRLRGVLSRLGSVVSSLAGTALRGLLGVLSKVKDSLAGVGGSALQAGKDFLKSGLDKMASAFTAVKEKAQSMFGAVARAGTGFVHRAAGVAASAISTVIKAGLALAGVGAALAVAGAAALAAGGHIRRVSPRASAALDRIGEALNRVRDIFLEAILTALIPLLEDLALAMEDPRFIAFVTLLAEDLGGAILDVSAWLRETAIPALVEFWEGTEEARDKINEGIKIALETLTSETIPNLVTEVTTGWASIFRIVAIMGPPIVAAATGAWNSISAAVSEVLAEIKQWVTENSETITGIFRSFVRAALLFILALINGIRGAVRVVKALLDGDFKGAWVTAQRTVGKVTDNLIGFVTEAVETIGGVMDLLGVSLQEPWEALTGFVEGVMEGVKIALQEGLNALVDALNDVITSYNDTIGRVPGTPTIGKLSRITLAEGGIVRSPITAVVGDNPISPEVVAPLHELKAILQEVLAGAGRGTTVVVQGPIYDPGGRSPEAAGNDYGSSFADAARRKGLDL